MTKRKRSAQQSDKDESKIRKNKPTTPAVKVPAPPQSLIRLLQKDKKVLQYFTALQGSLREDVQIWKNRAIRYKKQLGSSKRTAKTTSTRNHKIDESEAKIGEDVDGMSISSSSICENILPVAYVDVIRKGNNDTIKKGGRRSASRIIDGSLNHLNDGNGKTNEENKQLEVLNTKLISSEKLNQGSTKDDVSNDDINGKLLEDEPSISSHDDDDDDDSFMESFKAQMMQQNNLKVENEKARKFIYEHLKVAFQSFEALGVNLVHIDIEGDEKQGGNESSDHHENLVQHQDLNNTSNSKEKKNNGAIIQDTQSNENKQWDLLMNMDSDEDEDDSEEESSGDEGFLSESPKNRDTDSYDNTNLQSQAIVDDTKQVNQIPSKIVRRCDTAVINDLMFALRSLIRTPLLDFDQVGKGFHDYEFIKHWYQPFISCKMIPCCYEYDFKSLLLTKSSSSSSPFCNGEGDSETSSSHISNNNRQIEDIPQHPVIKGLHSICYALAIMDMYCSANSPNIAQDIWETLFESSNVIMDQNENDSKTKHDIYVDHRKQSCMKVGLSNRNITSLLISSLKGEIIDSWADTDRSIRGTPAALSFTETKDDLLDDDEINRDDQNIQKIGTNEGDIHSEVLYFFCTKNQNRLFCLVERICHARIVSFIYQFRSDIQSIAQIVIDYIRSTTPSPNIEDCPHHQPVMSICILEALLSPIGRLELIDRPDYHEFSPSLLPQHKSWFSTFLDCAFGKNSFVANSLSLSISSAIALWSQRKDSTDRRIRELSEVEIAAYSRLSSSEKEWMCHDNKYDSGPDLLGQMIESYTSENFAQSNWRQQSIKSSISLCIPIHLSLLQNGSMELAIKTTQRLISRLIAAKTVSASFVFLSMILACYSASISGLQRLKWISNCRLGLSIDGFKAALLDDDRMGMMIDEMILYYKKFNLCDNNRIADKVEILSFYATTIIKCCLILGDGLRAYRAVSEMVPHLCDIVQLHVQTGSSGNNRNFLHELNYILTLSESPLVRVINLKCRPDRWRNIISQTQRYNLLAVLAIAKLSSDSLNSTFESSIDQEENYWGSYAHSGKNMSHLELEEVFGSEHDVSNLAQYVATHWRPKDLKAFDRFARDDDALVQISVSERACALSHISSWVGVRNSLYELSVSSSSTKNGLIDEKNLLRMFRIGGFAKGASMLPENENIPPSPVCIIFEDDAMLVDRFTERLDAILNELPRDFHFCSIGYSRPKTAPLIPYSSQLGIPTCLWYLTGYILSLEGTTQMLDSLPVVGPVDSWIGLKMTSNWDNIYGERVGVGTPRSTVTSNHGKAGLPSRKEMGDIIKFRAFAALTPLCCQKLEWSSSSASSEQRGAKWRDRDTDISYSGRQ